MTTTIVYSDANDNDVSSTSTVYADAAGGAGTKALGPLIVDRLTFGQRKLAADYLCFEAFAKFDTTSLAGQVVSAAVLDLYGAADVSATDFIGQARAYAWADAVDTGDWRTATELAALTTLATRASFGFTTAGYNTFTSLAPFPAAIAVDGVTFTRIVLCSDRHVAQTVPAGDEYVRVWSAETAGTTQDPRLTITHSFQAAASGASTTTGSAAAIVHRVAAAAGTSTTTGAAAAALVRPAAAAGASITAGDAVAAIVRAAAASGASITGGSVAALLRLAAIASGSSTTSGTAAALLRLMASAAGASITAGHVASFLPRRVGQTVDDVLDLRFGQVQAGFVFDLVDAAGDVIGRLTPLQAASLSHSTDRRVYRRLEDLHIPPSEQADVNVLTDRVRVGMVVAGIARGELGHEDTPLPWGEYVFDDRPREIESWGELWHGALLDVSALLDDGLPAGVTYPAGFSVAEALAEQFDAALFTRYDIEVPGFLTFGAPISATVGTKRIDFMRQMAGLAACGLWAANNGRGRVASLPVGNITDPDLMYVAGRNIERGSILLNDTRLRAPNRWIVVDTAQASETVGVWDLPASAENSQQNRGRIITAPPRSVQGIPGSTADERQVNANALARLDALTSQRAAETGTFDGPIDPRHDTLDVVGVLGRVYVEPAWSARLETGAMMSHDVRAIYE